MAFWSSETLTERVQTENLIEPFNSENIKFSSYELRVGNEAFISSNNDGIKKTLKSGEQFTIPPGQFGLLISEEKVKVPNDAIGFISIKASTKFAGLINVSGFHVDPGFEGKLKFAVYNAGSRNIALTQGTNLFMLWFSCLDRKTSKTYHGEHADQINLTDKDIMRLHGEIASPAALNSRLTKLENTVQKALDTGKNILWNFGIATLVAIVAGLIVFGISKYMISSDSSDTTQKISMEVFSGKHASVKNNT